MNMRQHKRFRQGQVMAGWRWFFMREGRPGKGRWTLAPTDHEGLAFTDAEIDAFLMPGAVVIRPAVHEPVEEAKLEFVCVKVNGGDVVDTFDTREAALALVLKHAKQRKAKLQVLNSLTGQLEVFTEYEFTA